MDIKKYNQYIKDKIREMELIYPYASILIQSDKNLRVVSSTNESSSNIEPKSIGFVFKVFTGKHFLEYAESELSMEAIDRAFNHLTSIKSEYDIDISNSLDPGEEITKDFSHSYDICPYSISDEDIFNNAKNQRLAIEKMDENIKNVSSILGYNVKEEVYINRNKELYQKLRRFTNIFVAIFNDGKNTAEIYGGHSRIGGYEHAELDMDKVSKEVDKGRKILKAKRLTPGFYECILSPGLSGMLAHEAFGHGTESDMFLKKRARGEQYIGKQVASPMLNMWDSPDMNDNPDANASYFFDNEGTLASKTEIIRDGILVNGITDKLSAEKLNIKLTPNSRVQAYTNKVYARMTNTCFERGKDKLEDMISEVKHGFYLSNATNGMEDPKSWGMQLEALYAEEIVDGKLTGKIYSPVILTGYVPDILKSITGISEDFELATLGYCGKGHKEWVKVTDGGPYLKLTARLA